MHEGYARTPLMHYYITWKMFCGTPSLVIIYELGLETEMTLSYSHYTNKMSLIVLIVRNNQISLYIASMHACNNYTCNIGG